MKLIILRKTSSCLGKRFRNIKLHRGFTSIQKFKNNLTYSKIFMPNDSVNSVQNSTFMEHFNINNAYISRNLTLYNRKNVIMKLISTRNHPVCENSLERLKCTVIKQLVFIWLKIILMKFFGTSY